MNKKMLVLLFLFSILTVGCTKKSSNLISDSSNSIKQSVSSAKESTSSIETSLSTKQSSSNTEVVNSGNEAVNTQQSSSNTEVIISNNETVNTSNTEEYYYNYIFSARKKQNDYVNSIEDPQKRSSLQSPLSAGIFAYNELLNKFPDDSDLINEAYQRVQEDLGE